MKKTVLLFVMCIYSLNPICSSANTDSKNEFMVFDCFPKPPFDPDAPIEKGLIIDFNLGTKKCNNGSGNIVQMDQLYINCEAPKKSHIKGYIMNRYSAELALYFKTGKLKVRIYQCKKLEKKL